MGKSHRKVARAGLTIVELVIVVLVIAAIAAILVRELSIPRAEARWLRCQENFHQLAKGMVEYFGQGDNRFYPCPLGRGSRPNDFNGAEWLAALYWTGVVSDPDVFLCPGSGDTNARGKDIGRKKANDCGGAFGSQTISYAGLWWRSVRTVEGGALRDDFTAGEPMACDDTQGAINHGDAGGMNVLFMDSHVSFKQTPEVDITSQHGSVGQGFPNPPKTLLWRLKN
jgi:prepilin-type processing-associated H-X9-DG protein